MSVNAGLLRGPERPKAFPFGGAHSIFKKWGKKSKGGCLNLTDAF